MKKEYVSELMNQCTKFQPFATFKSGSFPRVNAPRHPDIAELNHAFLYGRRPRLRPASQISKFSHDVHAGKTRVTSLV